MKDFLNGIFPFDVIPDQASTYAERVDPLFYFLIVLSVIITVGTLGMMGFLAVRFRRIEGRERESHALEYPLLEIAWTIIPAIVLLAIFAWGAKLYADYQRAPESAMQIDVVGKQWMWKIQHPNGVREVNNLHVPVGQPIRLNLTSQDVLHDFWLPAFRVKVDVVPGRFSSLWFEPTQVGTYDIFCAEYCGTEHSLMRGKVTVMEQADYVEWLAGGPKKSPVDAGEFIFAQLGCATCHNARADSRGPDMNGVFGSVVTLTTGERRNADEEYLRESITQPSKVIVEGYTALMPSFVNQLSAEKVNNLIAYIKSIGKSEPDFVEE